MIKNSPIIILDEATSALDNQSEAVVQKALDNLMKDKTVIVIKSDIFEQYRTSIINNDKNSLFKSDKFRCKVPSNISCYASVSMLDALEYDELVDVITEQQAAIIGINTSRKKNI